MLAADKLQLQTALKQQATALKEKEFQLHHNNLMTVGTQAAVLAALDVTLFVEFNPPGDDAWQHLNQISPYLMLLPRMLRFVYYPLITMALCSNIMVVANTTTLSLSSTGLALRGPDGSMMTATDGLYEERTAIFQAFYIGLASTVSSVIICVWLFLNWEASVLCMIIAFTTGYKIYKFHERVQNRFGFDESQTVDFNDLFEVGSRIVVPVKQSLRNFMRSGDADRSAIPQFDNDFSEHSGSISSTNGTSGRRRFKNSPNRDRRDNSQYYR